MRTYVSANECRCCAPLEDVLLTYTPPTHLQCSARHVTSCSPHGLVDGAWAVLLATGDDSNSSQSRAGHLRPEARSGRPGWHHQGCISSSRGVALVWLPILSPSCLQVKETSLASYNLIRLSRIYMHYRGSVITVETETMCYNQLVPWLVKQGSITEMLAHCSSNQVNGELKRPEIESPSPLFCW
jgi:hypothetical protein